MASSSGWLCTAGRCAREWDKVRHWCRRPAVWRRARCEGGRAWCSSLVPKHGVCKVRTPEFLQIVAFARFARNISQQAQAPTHRDVHFDSVACHCVGFQGPAQAIDMGTKFLYYSGLPVHRGYKTLPRIGSKSNGVYNARNIPSKLRPFKDWKHLTFYRARPVIEALAPPRYLLLRHDRASRSDLTRRRRHYRIEYSTQRCEPAADRNLRRCQRDA